MILDKWKYYIAEHGKRHIIWRATARTKRNAIESARNDGSILQDRNKNYSDLDAYILPIGNALCIDLPDTYQRIYIRAKLHEHT